MTTVSRDRTGPVSGPGSVTDLEVHTGERDLTVAVTGLPRIYCFGLLGALAASGIRGTTPRSAAEWAALLAEQGALVVIVAQEQAAGLEQVLAAAEVPVPVVQVLGDLSAERCAQALSEGATGVMLLDAELADVVSVVQAAAASEVLLPRTVAAGLCGRTAAPAPDLRPEERQWLRRLADAWTVASLARHVGCSEREMYRLLNGVYSRLGATNRTEALLRAQRSGLLDDDAP